MNASVPMQVTCALIFDAEMRLLCARRGSGMSHAGKWELPGGKLEPGESHEECLIREIREELNISIEIVRRLSESPFTYPNGIALVLHPMICRITTGQPVAIEHQEIRWVPVSQLYELDWAAADIPVLQAFELSQPIF